MQTNQLATAHDYCSALYLYVEAIQSPILLASGSLTRGSLPRAGLATPELSFLVVFLTAVEKLKFSGPLLLVWAHMGCCLQQK